MSEFQIKVRPEPYRTRAGEKVYVKEIYSGWTFPFYCSDNLNRTNDGSVWTDGPESPHDIIGDWEEPPAPAASPDRMEVWLRLACAALNAQISLLADTDCVSALSQLCKKEKINPVKATAFCAAEYADAMLAEYERRKGGGA